MDTIIQKRKDQLTEINSFIEQVDKELTLVLQKFNWDRKHVLQGHDMVMCKYDSNHRIPLSKRDTHEQQCFLTKHGYHKNDKFLPEPPLDSQFMIKFGPQEINKIIEDAARKDPLFKRGVRGSSPEPLTADRVQCVYTSDERRALYDAVVATAPTHHVDDHTDLTLPGSSSKSRRVVKSREEVLAELRDMKRRRTKYRVAPKSKNYSDVLRDVIQAQMESYKEAKANIKIKQEKTDDGYDDHGHSRSSLNQDFRPDKIFKKYDNRRYPEEHRSERYKEHSKRNERDYRREENKDRDRKEYDKGYRREENKDRKYRKEHERVIKIEKDDEWNGRSKNDEDIKRSNSKERRKGEKYRPERSNRDYAEYRTSSKYGERYKPEKERDESSKYSDEKTDKHKFESSKDDSYKRHKKDKKKTHESKYERDDEYNRYRHDKDSNREKRDRGSETVSNDRNERKRKHDSQEYGHVSYYDQYNSQLQEKTHKE